MEKMSKIDMVKASDAYEQILFFALEALRRNGNRPMRVAEFLAMIPTMDLQEFQLDRAICNEAHVRQSLFLNGLDWLDGTDEIDAAFCIQRHMYPRICEKFAAEDFWGPRAKGASDYVSWRLSGPCAVSTS